MVVAPVTHSIRDEDLLPEEDEPFVPHHAEEGPHEVCWTCHGFLVGPLGRRLCACGEPDPIAPGREGQALAREDLIDVLADALRGRWFDRLKPEIRAEEEARSLWDALYPAARRRAASKLAERGLA
jgi:hypothetical protein